MVSGPPSEFGVRAVSLSNDVREESARLRSCRAVL